MDDEVFFNGHGGLGCNIPDMQIRLTLLNISYSLHCLTRPRPPTLKTSTMAKVNVISKTMGGTCKPPGPTFSQVHYITVVSTLQR